MRTVSARVSTPASPGHAARAQPGVQVLRRAPVGRLGNVLLHHQAARGDRGGLDVLGVGADIADMREGEGDDLAGIGRVGQRLLVAGHAGVEADLADRRRRRRYGRRSRGPRTPRRRPAPGRRWRRGARRPRGRRQGEPLEASPRFRALSSRHATRGRRTGRPGSGRWRRSRRANGAREWRRPGAICAPPRSPRRSSRAAASAPPRRSMMESTVVGMGRIYGK